MAKHVEPPQQVRQRGAVEGQPSPAASHLEAAGNRPKIDWPLCGLPQVLACVHRYLTRPLLLQFCRPFFDACDAIWVNYTWKEGTPALVWQEVGVL